MKRLHQCASSISHIACFSRVLYSCSYYNALLFSVCLCLRLCGCACMSIHRYNGCLPNGDRGRRKSRFALYKRPKANGVKPSTVHVACSPQAAKVKHTYAPSHTHTYTPQEYNLLNSSTSAVLFSVLDDLCYSC